MAAKEQKQKVRIYLVLISDTIASITSVLTYFVPGYIFLKVYHYFLGTQSEGFESTAVVSVVLSFVLTIPVQLLSEYVKSPSYAPECFTIVLAVLCAIAVVIIKRSKLFQIFAKKVGKRSAYENFWIHLFEPKVGASIRCFTQFNNESVMVRGNVAFFEPCGDGDCNIAIADYVVTYKDGRIYENKTCQGKPVLYINTRNIHGLEVLSEK